jgi:hypothetical protein
VFTKSPKKFPKDIRNWKTLKKGVKGKAQNVKAY